MPNQYKNKVIYGDSVLMDITDTTAEAGDVASGAVFYAKNGARTVGTFTQAQSDWIEDDTTDPAYILNRTHYKESIGNYGEIDLSYLYIKLTESSYTDSVINKTYSYKTTSTSCYSTQVNGFPNFLTSDFDTSATSAKININGVEYTLTQLYVPGSSESAVSYFYYYNDDVLAKVGVKSTYLDHFNVSLYTNSIDNIDIPNVILYAPSSIENYHYYTLDNRYLDGVLPKRGLAYASEVFNEQPRSAAKGLYSHAEGRNIQANGHYAHAEGIDTIADGTAPHAEGYHTWANNLASHAEGQYGLAFNDGAHVEGSYSYSLTLSITLTGEANATTYTVVDYDSDKDIIKNPNLLIGYYCSAKQARIIDEVRQGGVHRTITLDKTLNATEAITEQTFTFYCINAAYGQGSHAEGVAIRADGAASHAEGYNTNAIGIASHSEGRETIAKYDNQHVQGKYNLVDPSGLYADIVGNGTGDSARSNAYTLDWSGNGVYAGKLTVGAAPTDNMDVATKQYVDNKITNINSFNVSVVQSLPTTNIDTHTIYFISNSGTGTNVYDEYIYVNNAWEKIGTTDIDLTGYATEQYVDNALPSASSSTPLVDGTASAGSSTAYARGDHVHPVSSLAALSDTTVSSPSNGQVLIYDSTSSKWVNFTLTPSDIDAVAASNFANVLADTQAIFYELKPTSVENQFKVEEPFLTIYLSFSGSRKVYFVCPDNSTGDVTVFTIVNANIVNHTITLVSISTNIIERIMLQIDSNNTNNMIGSLEWINIPLPSSSDPLSDGTAAVGVSTAYARADHVHPKITQTISMSNNVITLTGSDGSTSSVTLPVYDGTVTSGGGS